VVSSLLPEKRIHLGQTYGMPLEMALCEASECNLSEREKDVLACLAAGYPNKQIGFQTGLSESTVKIHLRNIMQKIGATNRTQAAIWALRNGILHQYTAAK
jgi:two-component system nitrate/nitrite response regulator NarL